jgi:hypothetical protein
LCPNARDCHTLYTVDAEYLLWFFANSRTSVPAGANGPLGPGVNVLVPLQDPEHSSRQPFQGGRLALGCWLVEDNPWFVGGIRDLGVEATFFLVGSRSITAQNNQAPNLVRPFSDVNNDVESGFVVTAPGVASGGLTAFSQISNLWGTELNLWKNLYYDCPGTSHSLSGIAGFRYLSADYLAQISSLSNFKPGLTASSPFFPLAGDTLSVLDSFTTHNRFYGGQVGIVGQVQPACGFVLQAAAKLALGVTTEDLFIAGSQLRTLPNGPTISSGGGVLALPSNIGHFQRNEFAQVPELELRMLGRVTDHITLTAGFSLLDWTRLLRAVSQIDHEVDSTQIPNFPLPRGTLPTSLTHPAVLFQQDNLLALTLSLGLEIRY